MADSILAKIKKVGTVEKQILWAEVYAPDIVDTHGDFMKAEEIEKMAYDFARKGRLDQIDVQHDNNLYGCCIVETFIARSDDSIFIPGSWVVAIHVPDESLWSKVKSGEINGLSMEAMCLRKNDVELEFVCPVVFQGICEKAEDGHEHTYTFMIDDAGNFAGGFTDTVNGHSHEIKRSTVTETADDHNHRYSVVEKVIELNGKQKRN